jgi:dCMP deaminase
MTNWDMKYSELARYISSWSKDPSIKVGSITVGGRGQILSQGYNGFPRGIEDTQLRLNNREEKYKYVVHAEMNCIYNATLNGVSLNGATLYVYGLPVCSECAKGVIQVGIKRVVIYTPEIMKANIPEKWKVSGEQSYSMFKEAGVSVNWYDKVWVQILFHFNAPNTCFFHLCFHLIYPPLVSLHGQYCSHSALLVSGFSFISLSIPDRVKYPSKLQS